MTRSAGFSVDETAKAERANPHTLRQRRLHLADYLTGNVLDHDELFAEDILDALASLGTTLVEDQIADGAQTYYETLAKPDAEATGDD